MDRFVVAPELQQFLSMVPSKELGNVVWDIQFSGTIPTLPANPGSIRRVLIFDKGVSSGGATPVTEWDCYLEDLSRITVSQITFRRGF